MLFDPRFAPYPVKPTLDSQHPTTCTRMPSVIEILAQEIFSAREHPSFEEEPDPVKTLHTPDFLFPEDTNFLAEMLKNDQEAGK